LIVLHEFVSTRKFMRRSLLVCAAVVLAGVLGGRPQTASAGLIELTMTVTSSTFDIFARITDQTAVGPPISPGDFVRGIAGYIIDVTSTGNVVITSIANQSPTGAGLTGFVVGRSTQAIPGGMRAGALQNTSTVGMPQLAVLEGVGLVPGSDGFGAMWAHPVRLVSGTYTGTLGTIMATPVNTSPGSPPQSLSVIYGPVTGWNDPAKVEAALTNSVVVAIPEPASLSFAACALAAAAFRWRRRRATQA
jgi:hypothetical protein